MTFPARHSVGSRSRLPVTPGGYPQQFVLTCTGPDPALANVALLPASTWPVNDPIGRSLPAATHNLDADGVLLFQDGSPEWGNTYDIIIYQTDFEWGVFLGNVIIESFSGTVDLDQQRQTPLGLGALLFAPAQWTHAIDYFAVVPDDGVMVLIRCETHADVVRAAEALTGGDFPTPVVWGVPRLGLHPEVNVWAFNEVFGDYTMVQVNVSAE